MRKLIYTIFCMAIMVSATTTVSAQRKMKIFEHVAISLNAGTIGFGAEGATPLSSNFVLRGGVSFLPGKFTYRYDEMYEGGITPDIHATLNHVNGKILVDYYPFSNASFHITAGAMFGSNRLITAKATTSDDTPIIIGDIEITPEMIGQMVGKVEAWAKIHAVKPYIGLGFGNAIPKKRVGFKFEVGAMFHGKPVVQTHNVIVRELGRDELDGVNKFISKLNIYPYLNFQLSYRIF